LHQRKYQQNKWIALTFFGHETQQVAKIFKEADTRIAFRTINTINTYNQNSKKATNMTIAAYTN
jgi:hypothetical protein